MVNAGIMDVWVDFALQVIDDELLIELKLLAVSNHWALNYYQF